MNFSLKILFLSTILINSNECFNILMVVPIKSFSHIVPQLELAKILAKRGHNVTFISTQQRKEKIENLRSITVNISSSVDPDNTNKEFTFEQLRLRKTTYIDTLLKFGIECTEGLLNNSNIKELLLNPNEKFDVVVVEQFLTFALQGFCHHFEAHCIIYSPIRLNTMIKPLLGYVPPLAYPTDPLLSFKTDLSFFERIYHLYLFLYTQFKVHQEFLPVHNKLLKRYFKKTIDINDIISNTSLVLQNSHPSINYPAPESPNVVEIGGFHITEQLEEPTKEIKQFLDSSKEGVIYFSFGSFLKSRLLSKEKLKALLTAFSKLNVKILWKYEGELKDKPENVKILKWAPQKYILAHPNVKLFISHGGMFSTIEAVYFGKPILGIPIFGDQLSNMMFLESIGMARFIDYDQLTEEQVFELVEDILYNKSYLEKAQQNSKLLRDQPISPMDKAIFWIEFVYRQKGGSRFSFPGLNIPFYKQLFFDVTFFIFIIFILFIAIGFKIVSGLNYRLRPIKNKSNYNKKEN